MFEAKVIEDSASAAGVRLTTLQLQYPRFIHSEMMTHRVFSRNASSSRAIPVAKMIEQVRSTPAAPIHWGANQPGMQARAEVGNTRLARDLWLQAAREAADTAELMAAMGLHKQVVNRILEPFQWMHIIVTATEWDNFFELRDHPDAEPNIQLLAQLMKQAMDASTPRMRLRGEWHLPYISQEERTKHINTTLCMLSAARCARVSYLNHDGSAPDPVKDLELYTRLVGGRPMHASPIEHQACPLDLVDKELNFVDTTNEFSGNFRGWQQFRKIIEAEMANS